MHSYKQPPDFFLSDPISGSYEPKTGKATPLLAPTNEYMGTAIVVPITRRSLGLRSHVNMGTEGQGYGDWTNTHDKRAIGRAFFQEHANVKGSALRRKMTDL